MHLQQLSKARIRFSGRIGSLIVFFIIALGPLSNAQQIEIFASPDGEGDGTSYATPGSLYDALENITTGDSALIYLIPGNYDASTTTFELLLGTDEVMVVNMVGGIQEDGSVSQDNSLTVLDGGDLNRIFKISTHANGAKLDLRIAGMTFQNGLAADDGNSLTIDHGAAIYAFQGNAESSGELNLLIEHCDFSNNDAGTLVGGAIYSNCHVRFADCRFTGNEASSGGAVFAGCGPGSDYALEYEIHDCEFTGNMNTGNQGSSVWHNLTMKITKTDFKGMQDGSLVGNGSCVWGNQHSTSHISQCTFDSIRVKYWGSAFQVFGGSAYIDNCIFSNNMTGEGSGYGCIAFYHANEGATIQRISNCTFIGNHSFYNQAGAIHNRGGSDDDLKVYNCIFWDNGSNPLIGESGSAALYNSDIEGGVYSGFVNGGGNINSDPKFEAESLRLQSGSLCINVGTNSCEPDAEEDLEGNFRILSTTIDMGAFEYNSAPDGIILDQSTFAENLETGSVVASLTGVDPDPEHLDFLSYDFITGDGSNDADNDLFELEGQNLKLIGEADYESEPILYILIAITDPGEASYDSAFVLKVTDANDPVMLNGTLDTNQTVLEGSAYSYTFPEDLFYDQDGLETVTVTSSLDDDSALPGWLDFSPASRTFSGTPGNQDVDSLDIKITATDEGSVSVSVNFGLKIEARTGVEEKPEKNLQIYPNPATDHLLVDFDATAGDTRIMIYNSLGSCVYTSDMLNSSPVEINISKLGPGMYLLKTKRASSIQVAKLLIR